MLALMVPCKHSLASFISLNTLKTKFIFLERVKTLRIGKWMDCLRHMSEFRAVDGVALVRRKGFRKGGRGSINQREPMRWMASRRLLVGQRRGVLERE